MNTDPAGAVYVSQKRPSGSTGHIACPCELLSLSSSDCPAPEVTEEHGHYKP